MKILPTGIAVIEGDTHLSAWVEQTGRLDHDQSTLPVILPLIKPGDVVVDAGANIGSHTIAYINAVGDKGIVLAFEPNPPAFECLMHNCPQANNYRLGLSDSLGFFDVVPNVNAGATHLGQASIDGNAAQTIRLDSFELPRLNFFKLDIEGFELLALRGARETIQRCRPIIMCELNVGALARQGHDKTGIMTFLLGEMGYIMVKPVFPNESMDAEQIDVLFFP